MFTKFEAVREARPRWLWLLPALGAIAVLGACTRSIDAAQTQVSNGLVYKLNDSDPFTGEVKNASVLAVSRQAEQGTCTLHYKGGRLQGTVTCHGEKGKKILEQQWEQGQRDGTEKIWDTTTGNLHVEAHWKAGKLDGSYEVNNPAIDKRVERSEYKNGELEGRQQIWDVQTGQVLLVDMEWNGGRQTGYSKLGEVEENYKDGKRHGALRHYMFADSNSAAAAREVDRLVQTVHGGGWFAAQFTGAKVDMEEQYDKGVAASQVGLQDRVAFMNCKDAYSAKFRKQYGPNALATSEQIQEWEKLCARGKPPE